MGRGYGFVVRCSCILLIGGVVKLGFAVDAPDLANDREPIAR